MMKRPVRLHIYRGHEEYCGNRLEGRKYTKCDCPIWMDGNDENGGRAMCSLHTRNWQVAQRIIRDFEIRGFVHEPASGPGAEPSQITLVEARQKFLAANPNLSPGRIKKYKLFFGRMQESAGSRGLRFLRDLNLSFLTDFRIEWNDKWKQHEGTVSLNIQMLRKFFRFCQKHGYVERNLASDLEMPKPKSRPTLPFTIDEWRRMLGAFPIYEKRAGHASAHRLRAFVLLLRFSGMRIGDAVRCEESWIDGNRISFVSQKTSIPVCNKLPDDVIQALRIVPLNGGRYFFWTGASTLHSAVGKWQRRLKALFELAGIRDGHAHRFRNSYAHDMAVNGQMTLEELKQALGHKTTRTTEKFYSHWLKDKQDRLEAKQERAWARQSALRAQDGKEDRPN
jgi:integrase/recombinase XerD